MKANPIILMLILLLHFNTIAQKRITDFKSSTNISSNPSNFVEFDKKAYFLATEYETGRTIWVTDGTENGTKLFMKSLSGYLENYTQFGSVVVEDTLYFSFDNAFWKMGKDQKVIQVYQENYLYTFSKFPKLGDKIFINVVLYYDLKDRSIKKSDNNLLERITSWMSIWGDLKEADDFFIFQFGYGSVNGLWKTKHVQFRDSDKALYLTGIDEEYLDKAFKINNKRYFSTNAGRIYNVQPDNFMKVAEQKITQFVSSEVKSNTFSFINGSKSSFEKYSFNGEKIVLDNQIVLKDTIKNISSLGYFNNQLYAAIRTNSNTKTDILKFDFENDRYEILERNISADYCSVLKEDKDDVYVSCSSNNQNSFKGVINKQSNQVKPFDFEPYYLNSISLNNEKIGSYGEKQQNGIIDYELYKFNPNPQKVKNILENGHINESVFDTDSSNTKAYFLVNEANTGKNIYSLNPTNNTLQSIYSNKNSVFSYFGSFGKSTNTTSFIEGGNYSDKIALLYSINNYNSNVLTSSIDNYSSQNVIAKTDSNIYFLVNKELTKYSIIEQKQSTILKDNGLPDYFYNASDNKKIRDYYFFTNCQNGNCNLKALNPKKEVLINVFDTGVKNTTVWNDNLIVIQNQKVYLISVKNRFEKRFLMDLDDNQYFQITPYKDFFLINTSKTVWYSKGTCQSSRVILSVESTNNSIDILNKNVDAQKIIFRFEDIHYLFDGNTTQKLNSLKSRYLQPTDNSLFYIHSSQLQIQIQPNQITTDTLFRYDLLTQKVEIVSISKKMAGEYLNVSFKEKTNGIVLIQFGKKLFAIVATPNGSDKINFLYESTNNYLSVNLIATTGNGLIFRDYEKIYSYDGQSLKLLYQLNPNDFFYSTIESNLYVYAFSTNRIYRFNKETKEIYSIEYKVDVKPFEPVVYSPKIIGSKLYAILKEPKMGFQLWEIDDAPNQKPLFTTNTDKPIDLPKNECQTENIEPVEIKDEFFIFPNPVVNTLNIAIPLKYQNEDIELIIYNSIGQIVKQPMSQFFYWQNRKYIQIDILDISEGNYYLRLSNDNINKALRFYK